jgi:hypothetical protein
VIPKISRGSRPVGLFRYLIGKGSRNEHTDPRLVAGSPDLVWQFGGRQLVSRDATPLGRFVDEPRRLSRATVTVVGRSGDGNVIGRRDAHIWHCPLSLHSDETALSDETWRQISHQFIEKMGFDGEAGEAIEDRCRWAAVRHGPSAGGSDHVHLVVGLVCENHRTADVHNDRLRAQAACRDLEHEFGLRVVEGRTRGAGERAYAKGELESDLRRGLPVGRPGQWQPANGSRQTLERIVRATASASETEHEFIRRLRAEGVLVRGRFAKGRHDEVTGYSVALRPPNGEKPAWYPGGQLSRELTLPRLRSGWKPTDGAVLAWQPASQRGDVAGRLPRQPVSSDTAQRCTIELAQLREQLRQVPVDDLGSWVRVASETSAVFAAWSLRTEARAGPLAAASRSLARSAQVRTPPPPSEAVPVSATRAVARALLSGGSLGLSNRALLTQLADLSQALCDAHRAGLQAERASDLFATLRERLPVAAAAVSGPQPVEQPRARRSSGPVWSIDRGRGR